MYPISVVLTTYNRAGVLGETIETLLAQTFRDFELIICDNCSPDHTEQVVREYQRRDGRIVYHRNSRNIGMHGNLNEGIKIATGEYLANVHDGDLYVPDLLEKWKSALDRNPRAAFVFNQYAIVAEDGRTLRTYSEDLPEAFPGSVLLEDVFFRRWRFGSPVWGTVMARRRAYVAEGLFEDRFGFIADVDMWMKLADKYDVAYIAEPLIRIREHSKLPNQFTIPHRDRILQQMWWEARLRHYRDRKGRLAAEVFRHACHVTMHQGYWLLVKMNAVLRGRNRRQA